MSDRYDWCATCGCSAGCHTDFRAGVDDDDADLGPCEACDMCNEYVPGGDD